MNSCTKETFYAFYQTRFQEEKLVNHFVKSDLEIKEKIFSALCISQDIRKILIVEYRNATQSFYSHGLLFTFDDSKTYYYRMKNGEVVAGKGKGGYTELNEILLAAKNDFSGLKAKINGIEGDFFDAPIVNVLLYDSLPPKKFDSFNFPIVVAEKIIIR